MSCWLIEHRVRLAGTLFYCEMKIGFFAHYGWTTIKPAAKKFNSKAEAEAFADRRFGGSHRVRIVEHK